MARSALRWLVPEFLRERFALKFAVSLVVLALVLTAIGIGATLAVRNDMAETVNEKYTEIASSEAEKLELWHENNKDVVRTMSGAQDLRSGDESAIRTFLNSQQAAEANHIQDIHYVNTTSGRVEVSTNAAMEGLAFAELETPWSNLENRSISGVTATGVYRGLESAENRPLIAYVTPVGESNEGRQERLLVATVRPSSYTEYFQTRSDTRTMVVDQDGRIVFSHQYVALSEYANASGAAGASGTAALDRARATGPGAPGAMRVPASTTVSDSLGLAPGTDVFVGYDQMPGTGWVVLVHTPASEAFGVVHDITQVGVAATLFGVALVAVVGYYLGRDTATAINDLSEKARQLQAGNYDVDFSTDRTDNIGRLYGSFGSMATALRDREQSLQAERDRLAALFENSSDCIARVELDEEPVVQDVNRRFEEEFGYESAAIEGESLRDLIVPPEQMDETDEIIQEAWSGEEVEHELRRQTADGMGDFFFRFVPISNGHAQGTTPIEGYAVYTDITERKRAQRTLETNNQSLRRLHEVTTDRATDFEETVERLLELGCERTGVDVGVLSHIEDGRYEVVEAVDPTGTVAAGDVYDLEETVCEITVGRETTDVVTLSDIDAATHETHPAFEHWDLDAYIATPVVVDGKTYGTVSFSSESAASGAFSDSQREVIKLIAQWLGSELERRQRQSDLTRSQELLEQSQRLANVGAWEVDVETKELSMTDEVYRILELPLDEEVDLERAISFYHPEDQERVRAAVERAIEEREGYDMEVRIATTTGEERWVHAIGTPIVEDGEVLKLRGAMQDITEQKRLEQELRTEREHFRVALENSPLVAFRMDTDLRYTWVHNPRDEFERDDALGKRDDDLLPPDEAEKLMAPKREVLETGEGTREEVTFDLPSGEVTYDLTIEPLYDEFGDICGVTSAALDVTERTQHERELERYREYMGDALNAVDDVFFILDDDDSLQRWNDSLNEVTGYTDAEIASMHPVEFFTDDEREHIENALETLSQGDDVRLEAPVRTKDGETIPFEFVATALENPDEQTVLAGIGRDVSERKDREMELERYETIIQAVGDPVYALDADGNFLFVNDATEQVTGYDPEELVGEHISTVMTEDDLQTAQGLIREMLQHGEEPYVTFEMELQTTDGDAIASENHMALLPPEDGQFRGTAGVVRDITDRLEMEDALRERTRRFETLISNLPGMVYRCRNEEGWPMEFVSEGSQALTGYEEAAIEADRVSYGEDVVHPDDRERVWTTVQQAIDDAEPFKLTYRIQRDDGEVRWVWEQGRAVYDEAGEIEALEGFITDVTDRKQHEQELEIAETLFENSQDALFVLDVEEDDEEFHFKRANPAYEATTGLLDEEIRGQTPLEVFTDEDGAKLVEHYRECVTRREPHKYEVQLSVPKADAYWETRLAPVIIDGSVEQIVGATRDITERKERERELEQYEQVLETIDDGVYVIDEDTRFVYVNEAYAELTGYDRAELIGAHSTTVVSEETAEYVESVYEELLATDRTAETIEANIQRADGTAVPTEGTVSVMELSDGEMGRVGVVRDVTERKEREEELARHRYLLEQTQELASVGGWELDLRTEPPYEGVLTDELKRIHEVPLDEAFDMERGIEFYHPEDQPRVREAVEGAIENGDPYDIEARLITAKGNERWVRTTCEPVFDGGEVIKLRGTLQDVTERKAREQELKATTERLDSVVSNVPVILFALDADGTFTLSAGKGLEKVGLDPGEVVGESVFDVYADNERIVDAIERTLEGEQVSETVEIEGTVFESTYQPVFDDDGDVTEAIGIAFDITERKRHERALRKTNRQLNALIENTSEVVFIKNTDGEYELMNEAAADHFDLGPDEVIGKRDADLFDAETVTEIRAEDRYIMETGSQINAESVRYIDGEKVVFLDNKFPYRDADGEIIGVMGISRDITDRKEREEELKIAGTLYENTQDVLFVVDVNEEEDEYRLERVNPAYEAQTGLTNEEVEGRDVRDIFGNEEGREMIKHYHECIDRCEPIEYVEQVSVPEEGQYWEARIAPVVIDGSVEQIVGATRNITERKAREEELKATTERLDSVVSNIPVILYALDADGTFTLSAGKGLEKVGLESGEVVGESVFDVFEGRDAIIEDTKRALDGETVNVVREIEDVVFESTYQPVFDEDGNVTEVIGVSFDITDRKQHEEELERQRYLLEQAQQLASVGGWELDLRTEPPYDMRFTDELKHIYGVPLDESFDLEKTVEFAHPADQERLRELVERSIEAGEPYNFEARLIRADDVERWVRASGEPAYEDGELVKYQGVLQDITDRKQYELALESLHDATRELLHTESETEICEVVVDIAEEIIDLPGICTYLLDSERNEFVPTAFSSGLLDVCERAPPLPVGDDDSPAWNAFVSGETVSIADPTTLSNITTERLHDESIHTTTRVDPEDLPACMKQGVDHGLFVPVGDHGVFAVLGPEEGIDDRTRQLAETLVATTEAAFDRLESEANLRERDQQLQTQNERLKRQIEITDIIRTVDQSLIDATSREEIETEVCERLVESDVISFAWIGGHDTTEEAVTPQSWAGDGHSYLDSVSLTEADDEPAWLTAESESPTVVGSVVERLRSDPWRRVALEHDFRSVISVPIGHDEYTYGVLTAYAPDANTFGDLERSVFEELGETVGNTINAVQTKQALYMDTATELKLRFFSEESLLLKLATDADCRVDFDGLSAESGETARLFFTVTGVDPDDIEAILDRLVAVTDYRVISSTDDGGHFEATVSEGLVASTLVSHGVRPRSMVAEDGELDVIIDVPRETDVREFVELLQDRYQSVELIARRDVERSIGTKADLVGSLLGALTDRQRETLTTAYYSGFFEWPRETTGEEVATMLDVSQPTVNRHLRLAQRTLLGQLFDTEQPPAMTTA